MQWTYESVQHARDAVSVLLDQLGLDAYLFGVEPREGSWEVRLEYATESGWASQVLAVDSTTLVQSFSDLDMRSKLLETWGTALQNAKRAPS